jgi:two-component system, LytTR family, sensor kinase
VNTPSPHTPSSVDRDAAQTAPGAGAAARGRRSSWPLYLALALLFGLYLGINQIIGIRTVLPNLAKWKPITWEVSSVLVILALIPLIVRFENRWRLDARPRTRAVALHALGAIVFSLVHTTGMVTLRNAVYALAGERYDYGDPLIRWVYELQKDVITYAVILGVIFAFREFRVRRAGELRAAELVSELSAARLQHLTAQIEPHFLFNALNAISNRMHEDVEAADRMISSLADLLRAAYSSDGEVLVPLGRELSWLKGYAAMMSERFRGQLQFELEVDAGLESVHVPRLLLQPLVENALRHGLCDGHGLLRVEVRRVGGELRCTVSDDGAGLPEGGAKPGTGLANVARRLELLFPATHSFSVERGSPRGTVASVAFPLPE